MYVTFMLTFTMVQWGLIQNTFELLSFASLISNQHGPIRLRLMMKCSRALVFVPKTWLKVSPVISEGRLGTKQ